MTVPGLSRTAHIGGLVHRFTDLGGNLGEGGSSGLPAWFAAQVLAAVLAR